MEINIMIHAFKIIHGVTVEELDVFHAQNLLIAIDVMNQINAKYVFLIFH